ncbi:30S ribosomal protein S20 [Candidatus Dojkabacteria bacterium]|nr:30S ribosomal protein S20 [Candidatus Dojkabacteria bacterium]
MANTKSAKKAIRVQNRKRSINMKRIVDYKSARKAVIDLLNKGDVEEAEKKLPEAQKAIDKAAKNNTIHPNKAARLKSRLSAKILTAKAAR